jgi:hypothetical protein
MESPTRGDSATQAATNDWLDYLKEFYIQKYEEGVWLGDWGGPPAELVRMIARKKQPS